MATSPNGGTQVEPAVAPLVPRDYQWLLFQEAKVNNVSLPAPCIVRHAPSLCFSWLERWIDMHNHRFPASNNRHSNQNEAVYVEPV